MPHHPRGEIWLGELVTAIGALAPDDAALAAVAGLLGLGTASARPARAKAPVQERFGREQPPAPMPEARADAPRADSAQPTAAGSSHRLPLAATPAATDGPADPVAPDWLASQPALPAVDRFDPPRAVPPLLPPRTRRAVLARLLATTAHDGALDVARIVAQVGRGHPLVQLPRLPRPTLRHGAELRCDFAPWLEPFAPDQEALLQALDRLLPAGRLRALAVSGAPEPDSDDPDAILLRGGSPSPSAPLLLASDLGRAWRALGEPGATPQQWQRFIDLQRKTGRRVAVLAPAAHAHARRLRGVALLPWAERSGLGDVRRALAGQGRWPRPASPAAVQALAQQVSVAQQVSLWHLRMARRALGQPPATESALWFSDLVQSRGIEGLVLAPQAAAPLRAALQGEQLAEALALRQAAHAGRHAGDGQGLEEALHDLELTRTLDAVQAERVLRPALRSIADGDRDVALWAAHAWERLSPAVRAQPAVLQLAFASSALLSTGAWLVDARGRRPTLPARMAWLTRGPSADRMRIGVELRAYADGSRNLVVGTTDAWPTNACAVLDLPRTRPLWLRVSGGSEGAGWVQTLSLEPGATQHIDVPAGPQAGVIDVEAMDGSGWQLTSTTSLASAVDRALLFLPSWRVSEWVAVAMTETLAVVPLPLAGDTVDALPGGMTMRYEHAQGTTGGGLPATVIGSLVFDGIRVAVLRRHPKAPVWCPLDPQLRMHGSVDPTGGEPPARFIVLQVPPIANADRPTAARTETDLQPPAGPMLIVPRGEEDWHVAWGPGPDLASAQKASSETVVHSVPWPELLAQAQALARRMRPWRWLLIGSPDVAATTDRLWDELRRGDRVEVLQDRAGLVFDALRAVVPTPESRSMIGGVDALLIVCGAEPPRGWPDPVQRAILGDMPRLWLPLAGGPQDTLRAWPEDLHRALMQWQALRVDEQAMRSGEQAAFDAVVEAVQAFPAQWRAASAAEEGTSTAADQPAAPPPAAPPPAPAPSLRASLLNALDKRSDAEIGLFQVDFGEDGGIALRPATWPRSGAPSLLLIHGEIADTLPSFDKLLNVRDGQLQRLREHFGGRILAWRWRSVAVSPVRHALALAGVLGGGAPAHVLSHGAGGLLPELMALAAAVGTAPDAQADAALARWRSAPNTSAADVAAWSALVDTVLRAPPAVQRFVRVACPVEGTDLFERGVRFGTSVWSTVLPFIGSALVKLSGIDRLLSDPDLSPGLVALKPGEDLQPLLTPRLRTAMPLTVVAGVMRSDSIGSWFKTRLASLTTGGENDLVVPLPSAFGGLERARGVNWIVDMGSRVSHFNFFTNAHTRGVIVDTLCAPEGQLPQGLAHADSLAALQQQMGSRGVREMSGDRSA